MHVLICVLKDFEILLYRIFQNCCPSDPGGSPTQTALPYTQEGMTMSSGTGIAGTTDARQIILRHHPATYHQTLSKLYNNRNDLILFHERGILHAYNHCG